MQLRDEIASVKKNIRELQEELAVLEACLDEEEEPEGDDSR